MSNFNVLKYLIIYLIIPIVLSKNLNDSFFQDNLLIIIIIGAIIIIIIIVIIYCCCCTGEKNKYTEASDMGLTEDKEKMIFN